MGKTITRNGTNHYRNGTNHYICLNMVYAVFYPPLKKVLLGESKDPKNYLSVMKYRLKKGSVKGEIQEHFSKYPDRFEFHAIDKPLDQVYKACEAKGYNYYREHKEFAGFKTY